MMRFPYRPHLLKQPPPPTLPAGSTARLRPMVAVRLIGPAGRWRDFRRAIIDSGADDTLFPADAATLIGASLMPGLGHSVLWRGPSYPLRFGRVELEVSGGGLVYRWPAIVGFCSAPLTYPLLGNTAFLEFFNATFQGADHVLELDPNSAFPGITGSTP
jgi:hypothetical protein